MILPPIFVSLFRKINREQKNIGGIFNESLDNKFHNPWTGRAWMEISTKKLYSIGQLSPSDMITKDCLLSYHTLVCLIINLLSSKRRCNILDFGGGTGFVYFKLYQHFMSPENVFWHVFDKNGSLYEIGKKYADESIFNYKVFFLDGLVDAETYKKYDIIYVNTVLHNIIDYTPVLKSFFKIKPQYIIFTRLFAGYIDTYITCQIHPGGYETPCVFLNFLELESNFRNNGYRVIFKSPCIEAKLSNRYANDIPLSLRIPYSINIIFENMEGNEL